MDQSKGNKLPIFRRKLTCVCCQSSLEKHRFRHEHAGNIIRNLIACERLKRFDSAETWRRKWLAVVAEKDGADSLPYASSLAALGWNLLQQEKWADAETALRECLAVREAKLPDDWTTSSACSLLGGALSRQGEFAEAERLLVSGYEGLEQHKEQLPPAAASLPRDALRRLVQLYTDWDKPDQAETWKQKLP